VSNVPAGVSTQPNILAVHQGYELYGSDRTFISSLVGLRERFPQSSIKVILPRQGVLADALRGAGFDVDIGDLWVVRKASGALKLALSVLAFPSHVFRAWKSMAAADVVYINTSVIFDFAVAARFSRTPAVIHIHEIPTGIAHKVVKAVVGFARSRLVYNSVTTQKAFDGIAARSEHVVLNGVAVADPDPSRPAFSDPEGRIRILMIGRINSWKGQDLLVEALKLLPTPIAERLDVRFAGTAFEDGPAGRDLAQLVEASKLHSRVSFDGFVTDPGALYQWADLAVVPSRKPEPFGLVAVEAMAHGRPVIAAGHGGLTEIVVDGETGTTFEPNNAADLAAAIVALVETPERAKSMGLAGRSRYLERFGEDRYKHELSAVMQTALTGADFRASSAVGAA
jgi:glycosyltransferase involved in cell wall biosynthesis